MMPLHFCMVHLQHMLLVLLTTAFFSPSLQAGIYDLLRTILEAHDPTFQHSADFDPAITVSAPDLLIHHRELRTQTLSVALQAENSDTELPEFQIEYSTNGQRWHFLGDRSHFPGIGFSQEQSFQIQLPDLNPEPRLQWLVIRIRILSPDRIEWFSVIAVLPDQQTHLPAIASDLDGTIALKQQNSSNLIPFPAITEHLIRQTRAGHLIAYITSRNISSNQDTREWLISNNLPPALILAAPNSFINKGEEARKWKKIGLLEPLRKRVDLQEYYGNSPIADVSAAAEARVSLIHLLCTPSQDKVRKQMEIKVLEHYIKLKPEKDLKAPRGSQQQHIKQHSYELVPEVLVTAGAPVPAEQCDYRGDLKRVGQAEARKEMQQLGQLLQQMNFDDSDGASLTGFAAFH